MATSRFFVANLPPRTTEQDLKHVFQDYGAVERVELKTKENPLEPDSVKVIAFVTLRLSAEEAASYLNDLNWTKVKGAKIKVSLAKESFLERLKREREEAEAENDPGINSAPAEGEQSELLLPRARENTRKTFTEAELDDDNDDVEPGLLITKKRAINSLHNGKIVIQTYDSTPIHVIETHKKKHNKCTALPEKSIAADEKRKKSLKNLKNQYDQKKSTIQQALAGLDGSASKKIKFSDAEDDEEDAAETKTKTNIFGSDDEEDTQLDIKAELLGKKGEKLLQMQSKQSLDPRFKIDAKFVDDDEEEEEEENAEVATEQNKDYDKPAQDERSWQFGILEQVVGAKFDNRDAAQKAKTQKSMQRYDPSKEEHQKFLRPKEMEDANHTSEPKKKKQKKHREEEAANDAESTNTAAPEVSKEVFYMVTDTLAQSLKSRGDGFSLLKMFDQGEEGTVLEQREGALQQVQDAKILVNKSDRGALQPFSYDSSSEGESDAEVPTAETLKKEKGEKKPKQVKVAVESFFIPRNDPRLKEGAKFFKFDKKQVSDEDYEQVRNRLKLLIRTKISKTKKNIISSGAGVQKRKFKQYK